MKKLLSLAAALTFTPVPPLHLILYQPRRKNLPPPKTSAVGKCAC